jgi:hypothetical protein
MTRHPHRTRETLLRDAPFDGQVRDRRRHDPGEKRPDVALDATRQMAVADLDAGYSRDVVEARRRSVQAHVDDALVAGQQAGDVFQRDEPTSADDRHAIAHALHLRQHVGREKDRPARRLERVEDVIEGPLHQRVETFGRFVEDGQFRIVLERLHDADLLAHAARVVADPPAQRARRQLQLIAQRRATNGRAAAEIAQIVEQLLAGERVVEGDSARQVSDSSPNLHAVTDDVEAEHVTCAGCRVQKSEQQPDGRALAGAIRSEEAEDLAFVHLEVQRIERSHRRR